MASEDDVVDRLNAALAERYRIESAIGSGGMATVYLAHDLKHDRKVAVKVLKPELAAVMGTDRFLAEIRTTANLSHPHILPLHDSGEADGFLFYVMPYVEGESLKEKLDRDGQLSVDEAVRIAGHVADALDYAHRHGVIHRDVKPANILFQEGEPTVTDFGIALAVSTAGEGRLTETGLSLGTPYYMSPEQAAGDQTPTAASDVYSLGCVLYEMLTGDPPHTGASAQAILGKILLADVTRPTKLRRTIPANVEAAVLKALERLPADRFESAGELVAALKDRTFRHGVGTGAVAGPWKGLAIAASVVAVLALAAAAMGILMFRPSPPPTMRLQIHPPSRDISSLWARDFALAPDGSSMVYRDTAGMESGWQLWVKDLGSLEARPLPGTERASDVVYSPDGQWIAYRQGNDLVKRPIQGTGTQTLFEDVGATAIDWQADGTILARAPGLTLVRVSQDLSAPVDTVFVFPEHGPTWIRGLPGGEAALVVRCVGVNCVSDSYLSVVDFRADTTWTLQGEVLRAWYVPTGDIVWVSRDGAVFARPFDADRLEFTGASVRLFEGVGTGTYVADMVMAENGTVVYIEGEGAGPARRQVVWVDRVGRSEPAAPEWKLDEFTIVALSPDGDRLAVVVEREDGEQIWVKELPAGPFTPLTTGEGSSGVPTWSPDGSTIAYTSNAAGDWDIRTTRSDGSSVGTYDVLLDLDRRVPDAEYTPDGSGLVFRVGNAVYGRADLGLLDMATGDVNEELLATEFSEFGMTVSPDGDWLAYTSDHSGRREVYVRRFPDLDTGFRPVSLDGGSEPLWSENSSELFYRGGNGSMMAATYAAGSTFDVLDRVRLFDANRFHAYAPSGSTYDYSPSRDRFVMVLLDLDFEGPDAPERPMIMVQNFFTELEEKMARGR